METTPGRGLARLPVHARWTLGVVLVLALLVLTARGLWHIPAVEHFVDRYPGRASGAAWVGNPPWVCVLHAANLFLVVSLVRSALLARRTRRPAGPAGYWRRRRAQPWLAKKERPAEIRVEQWFHTSLGALWLGSGALFVVLMLVSGRWVRLVPTSWDVVPNAASVALQYLSWHWPHDDTWVSYNALQMLAYGGMVFVLAPLAALTGLRQSALWPDDAAVNRWFTVARTRSVHSVVQMLFIVFVVVHLTLVLGTGALRNLNHMFGARDDTSVLGPHLMAVVVLLAVGAWFAARPAVLRTLAGLFGTVTRESSCPLPRPTPDDLGPGSHEETESVR